MKGMANSDVNPFKIGNETSYNTGNPYSNCPNCKSVYVSNITKVRDYKSEDEKYELRISTTAYECSKCKLSINHIDYIHNEGKWISCGVHTETNTTSIKGDLLGPI